MLGFHGCSKATADRVLAGKPFLKSQNNYDWLGEGVYFWESNPQRGVEFAREKMKREKHRGSVHVVGAVIDLGLCLDLTTSAGIQQTRSAFSFLRRAFDAAHAVMPKNGKQLKKLDCAVINYLHRLRDQQNAESIQTVRGVFVEGDPAYEGAGFAEKTHIQLAVRDLTCIKGVFRVPPHVMSAS
ncbi:MAG: hypothetical protein Q8L22_28375 [Reyranella sp.]|nr:hypothetical protein [Reyranella sp.]